jgi:hypothetical protein
MKCLLVELREQDPKRTVDRSSPMHLCHESGATPIVRKARLPGRTYVGSRHRREFEHTLVLVTVIASLMRLVVRTQQVAAEVDQPFLVCIELRKCDAGGNAIHALFGER